MSDITWWISNRSIVTGKIHHILHSDDHVSTQGLVPSLKNGSTGGEDEGVGGGGEGLKQKANIT